MKYTFGVLIFLILFITVAKGQDVTLPYSQDFESAVVGNPGTLPATGWSQVDEGPEDFCTGGGVTYSVCHQWGVNSGGTASSATGPSGDHTTGSGNYVFVEASGNGNPEVFLLSPTFDLLGAEGTLRFWAHNYSGSSAQSRNLFVDVLDSGGAVIASAIETVSTSFSINDWRESVVSLNSYSSSGVIRLRFRWDDGSDSFRPDVAIDDVLIEVAANSEILCNNGVDEDSDGLIDCFDPDCDFNSTCDIDSDGILNRIDLDDDNDGITDALECYNVGNLISNPGFESGNTGFSSDYLFQTCTQACGPARDVERGEYAIEDDACSCGSAVGDVSEWIGTPIEGDAMMLADFDNAGDIVWSQTVNVVAEVEYSFVVWALNINAANDTDPRIRLGISTDGGSTYTIIGTSANITEAQGWSPVGYTYVNGASTSLTLGIISDNGGNSGREIALDGLSFSPTNICDSDADGVLNSMDLDSDNDGIYDVFESSSGANQSGGRLTGGVDSEGIPNSVSDGSSSINYQIADSNTDGIIDAIEVESDGDGCFDAFEEGIEDLDTDGRAGTGDPTVDANGLNTSLTYTAPTFNLWQSPGEDNPSCDGDTDDDGILDRDDLDDDNDGIPDVIESPASIDFSGTRTVIAGSGTLTNLDIGDVVLYEEAIRDCNDILYDIIITINEKGAGVTALAAETGINITNSTSSNDRYSTFTIAVVELASATAANPAGTPATIPNFVFEQRDIDSNLGADETEVVGISNATPPDSLYFDPLTLIEPGGFVNGGGPGPGFTYHRMIMLGGGTNGWSANDGAVTADNENTVFAFYNFFSSIDVAFGQTGAGGSTGQRFTRFSAAAECDRDGDGIPNRIDLDLDNDGIYDLYEAGHNQTADVDGDGIIDGATTGSGANGLYDGVETSPESGNVNYTYSNSDGDVELLYDFFELDSDGDLCFDVAEAGIVDGDVDGIAGTGVPLVDALGRVVDALVPYTAPPTFNWQDATQSCLEVCDNGLDDDGDGLIDEFDPDCASLFLEAECGFPGANWVRTFDADASNDDFQTIMPGLNSTAAPPTGSDDILRFTVTTLAAGTYRILGRVNSNSGGDDSFWVRVNEGTWVNWNNWNTGGTWEWIEFHDSDNGNTPTPYVLSTGSHTIDIAYREDGAGIDKLHLTINGSAPIGEGELAINCSRLITTNLFLNYKIRNRN